MSEIPTIEEIIKQHLPPMTNNFSVYITGEHVYRAMKAYGELCIEKALMVASEKGECVRVDSEYNSRTMERDPIFGIDQESIISLSKSERLKIT